MGRLRGPLGGGQAAVAPGGGLVSGPVSRVVQVRGRARERFWGGETTCRSLGPGISPPTLRGAGGGTQCLPLSARLPVLRPLCTELSAVWLGVSPTAENARSRSLLFRGVVGELRALGRKCGGAGVLCLRRADPEAAAGAIDRRCFLDNGCSPCVSALLP